MSNRYGAAAVALAVAVIGIAAAGCTSSSDNSSKTNSSGSSQGSGSTDGTLTVGLTASDIPILDTGLTWSQGAEGYTFVGQTLYDGLTKLDLTQSTSVPKTVGGLATSWSSNSDGTKWTFHLRPGVKFTDGTPWNAEAAVFNIDRAADKTSPEYYAQLGTTLASYVGQVTKATAVNDMTVEIDTSAPVATLPFLLTFVPMGSEAAIKKLGNDGFAAAPVGTGPFKFASLQRGQQLTLTRNDSYWGNKAKIKTLQLRPIPDPTARVAALRSGQVNFIDAPSPDDVASLKSSGFQIFTNFYDQFWNWQLNTSRGPLSKVQVRQALNYAIDRDTLAKTILQGIATPNRQVAPRASAVGAYSASNNVYSYDPAKAKQLLAEAGYPNGFTMTLSYPTAGSGNMQPKVMNEALQANLAKVGVTVKLEPVDWASLVTAVRAGKIINGADALQANNPLYDTSYWRSLFGTGGGFNLSHFSNPQFDQLVTQAAKTTDANARSAIFTRMAKIVTDNAPMLFVVSDLNPRALAKNVHGFVEPQSWYVDLTTVSVG